MYDDLRSAYRAAELPVLNVGGILVNNHLLADAPVNLLLKSFSRHGLIAGATGSGKTKTIQVLSEQLSFAGIPSLVMDIKGDISGLALPGTVNDALTARSQSLSLSYTPRGFPVEFLTLTSTQPGLPLRSTVEDFGAVLFARMLDVTEAQEGVITILFQYAKEEKLPLIDLADLKSLLQFAQTKEGNKQIKARFGTVSSASIGTLMRKLIELEAQGGDDFFGEPAFDVTDLLRTNSQGLGIISILRLLDMQDKPKLFSTFMLKLLADVYRKMPELGDPEQPKLVLFIDEAHLIFNSASKALMNLLDTMVKLIRSKGVGLIFCTQSPNDIPANVLSQLGLKIQHALRAFTAKDRTAMKLVAQNFPPSEHYDVEHLLTSLGIGEALLSALNAKGQPTPLIQCMIRAPESRMGVLTEHELSQIALSSTLCSRYRTRIDRASAKELLTAPKNSSATPEKTIPEKAAPKKAEADYSILTSMTKSTLFRQLVRQAFKQAFAALLIVLGVKKGK